MFLKIYRLLLFGVVCRGCDRSFFSRDRNLNNTRVNDASVSTLTTLSLDRCARHCHNNASCLSLVYNQNDGRCQLTSKIYLNPENTSSQLGNVVFRKRNDDAICAIPTSIANGRLLFIDGQAEGSKAELVCDDYSIPTVESGVCGASGTWVGFGSPCQQTLSSPYSVPAIGRIYSGSCLVVIATPTANTQFYINFQKQSTDYNFYLQARFTVLSAEDLVRNTRISGTWGTEERSKPYWPFVVNQEFNLTICAEDSKYRSFIDNVEMFTYNYRRPISEIRTVDIQGDVSLRKIRFLT